MKYEDLNPEQVAIIKRIIQELDELGNVSDIVMSAMLCRIAQTMFGSNAPRSFIDEEWKEVYIIYDAAKAEMGNGA